MIRWPPELSAGLTDEADAITLLVESGILDQATAIQLFSKVPRSEAEDRPPSSGYWNKTLAALIASCLPSPTSPQMRSTPT